MAKVRGVFAEVMPAPLGVLAFGEWTHSPDAYHPGAPRPICVVLETFERDTLRPLNARLKELWHNAHVEPMFVLSADISRIADAFPIKVLELRDRSRVLCGTNPFEGVEVDREHLRLRLEQETRNHLIRTRRQWLMSVNEPRQLRQALERSNAVLNQALLTFWVLRQRTKPSFADLPSGSEAARSVGPTLKLDLGLFSELSGFDDKGAAPNMEELFFRHLELLRQLADGVDRLGETP